MALSFNASAQFIACLDTINILKKEGKGIIHKAHDLVVLAEKGGYTIYVYVPHGDSLYMRRSGLEKASGYDLYCYNWKSDCEVDLLLFSSTSNKHYSATIIDCNHKLSPPENKN